MEHPWMIDEFGHAGREHLDPSFVVGYDRKQGPAPDDAASDDIATLRAKGLGEEATVVDLGAGTGRFAVAAAVHFGRVVAVDVSAEMLRVARDRAADADRSNVELVVAGFLSYEHVGALADAVHSRNALHQLPDFWKGLALTRIGGILRPGGLLLLHDLIFDFQPQEAEAVFDAWLARAANDPARGYTSEDLAEHIRSECSTFRWLFEPMLVAAGFEIVDASYRGAVYGSYTCIRR